MTRKAPDKTLLVAVYADLTAIHQLIRMVPNIVGPSCGARFCDLASGVEWSIWILLDDVALELNVSPHPLRLFIDAGKPCLDRERQLFRIRAGESSPLVRSKRQLVPLTESEHWQLGIDLKRMQRCLATAEGAIANAYGKRCLLRRLTAKALRKLLHLRSALDSVVHREFPDGMHGGAASHVYFGSLPEEERR